MKGTFADECNRTACVNQSATYYNRGTGKYYCRPCARLINEANDQELCTEVTGPLRYWAASEKEIAAVKK